MGTGSLWEAGKVIKNQPQKFRRENVKIRREIMIFPKCLDKCAELKLLMFEILPGAQAQYTVKHFQSLSSCHSD